MLTLKIFLSSLKIKQTLFKLIIFPPYIKKLLFLHLTTTVQQNNIRLIIIIIFMSDPYGYRNQIESGLVFWSSGLLGSGSIAQHPQFSRGNKIGRLFIRLELYHPPKETYYISGSPAAPLPP